MTEKSVCMLNVGKLAVIVSVVIYAMRLGANTVSNVML